MHFYKLQCSYFVNLRRGWQRSHEPGGAALQMVQEKARVILPHPEFASLDYYQREYTARQMDVEAFVAVLLEMLNTPEKVSARRNYHPMHKPVKINTHTLVLHLEHVKINFFRQIRLSAFFY